MPPKVESIVVRICDQDDNTVGAGFVVGDRLILTCSHILQDSGLGPGDWVKVVFHTTPDCALARVLPDAWYSPTVVDLALLQISNNLPPDIEVANLGLPDDNEKQTFSTLGYPRGGVGIPAEGEFRVRPVDGMYPGFPRLLLWSNIVTKGFSGAPILDVDSDKVVGIVSSFLSEDQYGRGNEIAFGISSELILDRYPELQITQSSKVPLESLCDELKSTRYAFVVYSELAREDEQFLESCRSCEGQLVDLRKQLASQGWDDQDCNRWALDDESDHRFINAAIACSMPRWWNVPLIMRIAPFDEKEERYRATHLHRWLSMTPFTTKYGDWGHAYRSDVRLGLQRVIRRQDNIEWRELHQELVAFWEQRRYALGEPKNRYQSLEIWEYQLNILYHKLCRTAQLPLVLSEVSRCLLEIEVDLERCKYRLKRLSEIIKDANSYQPDESAKRWIEHICTVKKKLELSPRTEKGKIISVDHQTILKEFWEPLVQNGICEKFSETQLQQRIWARVGDLYLERGEDLETLIDTYQKAGEDCVSAWIGQGRAYLSWEEYQQAIRCFSHAIDLDESSFEAFAFRGQAYLLLEEWSIALDNYIRALDICADVSWIWLELAQVHQHLKDYSRAQESFQKALGLGLAGAGEFSSDEIAAHLGLAEVSVELGDYVTAAEEWSWLIEMKENSKEYDEELSEFYTCRAQALKQVGEEKQAAQDRERAESLSD